MICSKILGVTKENQTNLPAIWVQKPIICVQKPVICVQKPARSRYRGGPVWTKCSIEIRY